MFRHEGGEAVQIGVVLGAAQGLQRAGQRAGGVGERQADPDGADVDAEHPAGRALAAAGRGGTFRCAGQPPLRSISVVSCETGGKPRLRSISVVGW